MNVLASKCLSRVWMAAVFLAITLGNARGERAIVLSEMLPGGNSAVTDAVRESVRRGGYDAQDVSVDDLIAGKAIDAARGDLLLLPNGRGLPMVTEKTIEQFVKDGGAMIVCGAPAWGESVNRIGGNWVAKSEYDAAIGKTRPSHSVIEWSAEELAKWKRNTSSAEKDTREVIEDGQSKALHVKTPMLTNWDTLSREISGAFPGGETLTCFRAKGGEGTTQLAIEWTEKDESRWIATVELSREWKTYVLPMEAFKAWQPAKERAADHLRVANVKRLSFGLALSHTDVGRAAHEYWIGAVGTAKHPMGEWAGVDNAPVMEGVSPWHQVYPMSDVAELYDVANRAPTIPVEELKEKLVSLQPRPGGGGFDKGRPWRWQALMNARSRRADHRGTVAAMIVETGFKTSVRAVFTPTSRAFYERKEVKQAIVDAAVAIRRGLFFKDAGVNRYTVFDEEAVTVGARVMNTREDARGGVTARIKIVKAGESDPAYEKAWTTMVPGGSGVTMGEKWTPTWCANGYVVTAELLAGGAVIDRVQHELHVVKPNPHPQFLEARDGGFWLNGKRWKANGINYMPSSGIGLSNGEVFEHWIGSAGYDPEIVDRDLRRIKNLGFNMVSAFIYRESMDAENLTDFLRRCDELGLKVNLSLRPGTPIDSDGKHWVEMIAKGRLAESETVFAYDLAWEACHWDRAYQESHYGDEWRAWVKEHRGAEPEKFWGFAAPRENGKFTVPAGSMMIERGAWGKMVVDYRAFLDELLAKRYGAERDQIRAADPHHAVSFRMNILGDPTAHDPNQLAYDPWGLRKAVDIWEPEGYGRIGDWEWVKPGIFTAAYVRLADASKPLMWAEVGTPVWDTAINAPSPGRLDFEARFYRDIYRMLRESGADGVVYWWYPGGYRVNERSDFGIINEDGTDRPVTKVIREEGKKFLDAAKPVKASAEIAVERQSDSRGEYGIYEKVKNAYWDAKTASSDVRLKWTAEPELSQ